MARSIGMDSPELYRACAVLIDDDGNEYNIVNGPYKKPGIAKGAMTNSLEIFVRDGKEYARLAAGYTYGKGWTPARVHEVKARWIERAVISWEAV